MTTEQEPPLAQPKQPHDPSVEIEALRQRAMTMGANDQENDTFDDLRSRLRSGEITSEEARKIAQGILASKQDYH